MSVKISADSTCDLPAELIDKYDVGILPMYIVRDGEALRDGVEISPDDIFAHTKVTGRICSTAAVNVADYIEKWSEWRCDYDEVLHFNLSSELSASYNNAQLAAKEVSGVTVVDSRSLSSGTGLLVLDAVDMAAAGMDAPAIAAELEKRTGKLDVSFVLDTLDYLRRGGRCSMLAALGANMLSLKPCIEVKDGAMGVGKKYRGSLEKCFQQYIKDRLSGRDDVDTRRIFVTDSGISEETWLELKKAILACQPFAEVLHSHAGCTISSHCGPGCMGILFYQK
jgi:DegV family protein with EDD domain